MSTFTTARGHHGFGQASVTNHCFPQSLFGDFSRITDSGSCDLQAFWALSTGWSALRPL